MTDPILRLSTHSHSSHSSSPHTLPLNERDCSVNSSDFPIKRGIPRVLLNNKKDIILPIFSLWKETKIKNNKF